MCRVVFCSSVCMYFQRRRKFVSRSMFIDDISLSIVYVGWRLCRLRSIFFCGCSVIFWGNFNPGFFGIVLAVDGSE